MHARTYPELTLGPVPLGEGFIGIYILVISIPSKKAFNVTAVVLYAKFPTQTEFCRFGRASPPSEISSGFFPFSFSFPLFGLDEVGVDFVGGSETSAANTASPEFSFRFFCLLFSACERTGSFVTVESTSQTGGESSPSDPESESDTEDIEGEANDDDEECDSMVSVEISASLRFALPDTEGFARGDMMEK